MIARLDSWLGYELQLSFSLSPAVKFHLTHGQVLHLLCVRRRCNLITVRSVQPTEYAIMNATNLAARFAQAVLALSVTAVSVIVFQFALLTG